MLSVQYPEIKSLLVHFCVHIASHGFETRTAASDGHLQPKCLKGSYTSQRGLASRARRCDTGCVRNEDFGISFPRDGLFSPRSCGPSRRGGARRLPTGISSRNAPKVPIQVGVVAARVRRATRPTCIGTIESFWVELPVGSRRAPPRPDGSRDLISGYWTLSI